MQNYYNPKRATWFYKYAPSDFNKFSLIFHVLYSASYYYTRT